MKYNNRGFSLVELCVAIAVSGMVLLALMDVMQYIKVMENKVRVKTDARTTESVGERYFWMGLKNAAPSFNNLVVADDGGKNFFDLNRDIPGSSPVPTANQRTLTMNLTTGVRTFNALLSVSTSAQVNNGYPEVMFLDPVKFYDIVLASQPSSVTVNWSKFRDFVNANNPNFLAANTQVLEVYVPSTIRNVGADTSTMPNSTSYFLRCSNVPSTECPAENFGGLVSFKNAANNTVSITSFDNYLKTIPSSSGGIPPVLARVVRMVRYELKANTAGRPYGNNAGDLYISTWTGSAFTTPILIADRIIQVVFKRPDISDPTITIDLTPQTADQRLMQGQGQ